MVEAFRVSLPLVHAFQTSSHRKSHLEHILVRVQDADGDVGWGEIASPSDPYYCPETVDICWLMLERYLGPALLGAVWDHPADVGARWAKIRGHHFAKAGLDIACWDLWSRSAGMPLARALGGEREGRSRPESAWASSRPSPTCSPRPTGTPPRDTAGSS